MTIVVQEASESDVPQSCAVEIAAYGDNPTNAILFPGPFPPDSAQKRVDHLVGEIKNDATVKLLKAVDEEIGEAIAFAKWHIFDTPEKAAAAEKALFFGAGTNQEACYEFFGGMAKRKKETMGDKPHLCMSTI